LNALRRLKEHRTFLELTEPISRDGAMFYTGSETRGRPIFERYRNRLMTRYVPPTDKAAIFPDSEKPYSKHYVSDFNKVRTAGYTPIVLSPFGPVPAELDEIYPLAQSLFPEITDAETVSESDNLTFDFIERMGFEEVIESDEIPDGGEAEYDPDVLRAKAIANYQFGIDAADAMFRGKIEIVKSRKTGKIRNVISDGEHILSLRAGDGLYTLRPEGAVRILERIPSPRMRVVVNDDSIPFVSEGRNAFAQFVLDADEEIRPMEEVIVVDKDDRFLATGRALLIKSEMKSLKKGIAVKVRTGSGDEA
jgi:7-cyano-7-deazaguanine tRNA-ribosyltransferase